MPVKALQIYAQSVKVILSAQIQLTGLSCSLSRLWSGKPEKKKARCTALRRAPCVVPFLCASMPFGSSADAAGFPDQFKVAGDIALVGENVVCHASTLIFLFSNVRAAQTIH